MYGRFIQSHSSSPTQCNARFLLISSFLLRFILASSFRSKPSQTHLPPLSIPTKIARARPHPTKPRRALLRLCLRRPPPPPLPLLGGPGRSVSREQKGLAFWFANMYFEGYGYRGSTFEQTYRCYPASFIDKPQLETGDKIIMPPSALDRLASLHIEYPMLFEVRNAAAERTSHCGVLEFIAEEGMIYMPYWMMQNLLLQEGDMVFIKNANLPKGTYVKLQPHTTDFLDISNPKAILEKTLRNYSCLTIGDSIMVAYNNKKYYIDIVEAKPSSAISIIETDCEVDFAPPLDYKEPERPKPSVPPSTAPTAEAAVEEEPKFTAFTGSGRRLDGKPSKDVDASSSSPAKRQANSTNSVQPSTTSTSQSNPSRKTTGKLVFGSGGSQSSKGTDKVPAKDAKEDPKKEEPKFSAFTGKKYSLKG